MQRAEISWKRDHVVIVVRGVFAQVVARELAGSPRLVIRMTEKLVPRNALFERCQESLQFHRSPHVEVKPGNQKHYKVRWRELTRRGRRLARKTSSALLKLKYCYQWG